MRYTLGLIALASACGRIGFAPADGPDGASPVDDANTIDAVIAVPDYCALLPALASLPVLDGVLEPGLVLAQLTPAGWTSGLSPVPAQPANVTAAFAFAWRPDGIYALIEVHDPDRYPSPMAGSPFCGDGIELDVDGDGMFAAPPSYDRPGTRQFVASAPPDAVSTINSGYAFEMTTPVGAWSSGFVEVPTPDGYRLEAMIGAAELGVPVNLAGGGRIGIDVAINVSVPDGVSRPAGNCMPNLRLGQYSWHVTTPVDWPFHNVLAFCTPALE